MLILPLRPAPLQGGRPPPPAGSLLPEPAHWRTSSSSPCSSRWGSGPSGPGRGTLVAQAVAQPPDWEEEMSLFRKRVQRPSQLQALRRREEEVELGKVLHVADGLAIVEGLDGDAPPGTALRFVSGAAGALLWRHSARLCTALLLGGGAGVAPGEGVECRVRAILQVVNEAAGPTTRRDYEVVRIPVGRELSGRSVDFLGREAGGRRQPIPTGLSLPLFNAQRDMASREAVMEPLFTGVKAVDTLTPVGRGQALLLTGPRGVGKTMLALDAILGQGRAGVRCVYAAVGQAPEEVDHTLALLRRRSALQHTTVVSAPAGAPLGERFGAVLAACTLGEQIRDAGGHSLVVLDDASCMVDVWEDTTAWLASLPSSDRGPEAEGASEGDSEQQLVEYEGMLVSAAAAQRRQFFSSVIQRAAKLHRRLGGGSMTLLLVLPGVPASGEPLGGPPGGLSPAALARLSPAQRERVVAALAAQQQQEQQRLPGCMRTEVVEEFMSIADGQVVLVEGGSRGAGGGAPAGAPTGSPVIDPQASVSRIGSRAHPPALKEMAPKLRFELAQAKDAVRYLGPEAAEAAPQRAAAQRLEAALAQWPSHPVPLEELVSILFALQTPLLDGLSPESLSFRLSLYVQSLHRSQPGVLKEIASTQQLTAAAQAALLKTLRGTLAVFEPNS